MKLNLHKTDGYIIQNRNLAEAQKIVEEKFVKNEYEFKLSTNTPKIIDAGAHIGITTLYFKKKYPESKIIAFEPDKQNCLLFEENMKVNNIHGVVCVNAALSNKKGTASLFTSNENENPWTWGNTIVKNLWGPNDPDNKEIQVSTVLLSDYITSPVDILKLDIEGAEEIVLYEIKEKLFLINNIVLEFHGTKFNKEHNKIEKIILLLLQNGFDVKIDQVDQSHNLSKEYIKEIGVEYYLVKASK